MKNYEKNLKKKTQNETKIVILMTFSEEIEIVSKEL